MSDHCPVCKTPQLPVARFCHVCGAPYGGMHPQAPRSRRWLRLSMAAMWAAWGSIVITAVVLGMRAQEWIALCAFAIISLSVLEIVCGLLVGYGAPVLLGWANLTGGFAAIVVTGLAIVTWPSAERWGPAAMLAVLALCLLPFVSLSYRRRPSIRNPWLCRKCGYMLYGLTESRCPECGTEFHAGSPADRRTE